MEYVNTFHLPSGRIFVHRTESGYLVESTEMQDVVLEGKENEEVRNSLDPRVIWKHLRPKQDKWLMTVSTQKGCTHSCKFCDVAPLGFEGNLSYEEILWQVQFIMENTPGMQKTGCAKGKIGFARMGEPSWNLGNVLSVMRDLPGMYPNIKWLPCFNSILPSKVAVKTIESVMNVKKGFNGNLHFQISCNSTDEDVRKNLFGGAVVMPISEIIEMVNAFPAHGRTVTLNFIVMKGVPIDVQVLKKMGLNRDKFCVKLIPMNMTGNAQTNGLETLYNYNTYDELKRLRDEFAKEGIPVVMDAIARCEEAGLCCGQLSAFTSEDMLGRKSMRGE